MGSIDTIFGLVIGRAYFANQKLVPKSSSAVEQGKGDFPTALGTVYQNFSDFPTQGCSLDVSVSNLTDAKIQPENGIRIGSDGIQAHHEIFDLSDPEVCAQFGLKGNFNVPFALKRVFERTVSIGYGMKAIPNNHGIQIYRPDTKNLDYLRLAYYTMVPSPNAGVSKIFPDGRKRRDSILVVSLGFEIEKPQSNSPD